DRVERVLGVDEGRNAAERLCLGHHVQGERGLAGGLRPVDLHHAAARQAADAERGVERERARGDDGDLFQRPAGAQAHDGALAELSLDRRDRQLEGLPPVVLALSHAGAPCVLKVMGPVGIGALGVKNGYARKALYCARTMASMSEMPYTPVSPLLPDTASADGHARRAWCRGGRAKSAKLGP